MVDELGRGAGEHHGAAVVACAGPRSITQYARAITRWVVFDDDDGAAAVDQAVEQPDEVVDVAHVQARCWARPAGRGGTGCFEWTGRIVRATIPGMDLRIQCLCVDSTDPSRLAAFWQSALGWRRTFEEDDEVVLEPPAGSPEDGVVPDLLFLRVPEEKAGKNRLHIDLRPQDQAAEVARLEGLGARRADVGQGPDVSWVVMADPDGNEFCVLRPLTPEELAED